MFRCSDSGGEFVPFLLVSKGKRLLARLLPFLKHDAANKILRIVTSNLPTLMSRDTEEVGSVLKNGPFFICDKSKISLLNSAVFDWVLTCQAFL